jgi:hypothetical protein
LVFDAATLNSASFRRANAARIVLARLSHLEGLFGYFRVETGVKLNACNGGISETVAVKTYPL